ncbi:MAG TPA: alcohol dehydrogenase catalytic domain-containing protein [Acetobacteraceae bacterium]|nr:alcohol dehydrogenase catalytic domain-containing protein [Acetobacteraceae bacterium]
MLSAIFEAVGAPLVVRERPMPKPRAGQALIRVCRCGICASDLHMTGGGPFGVPIGSILGHEYAGEVVDTGEDGWLRPGDRVTALPLTACGQCAACRANTPLHCPSFGMMAGGYAQYTLIDQRYAFRLPSSLSFEDGALVEPLAAALRGVRKLAVKDARVAVIGAGALGAAALFWLHRESPAALVAIARSERNAALAHAMGAVTLLSLGANLPERLTEALGGAADIVVECAGAPGSLQRALDLVRPGGSILSLGGCVKPDTLLPALAMWKEVRILFSAAYGCDEFRHTLDLLNRGTAPPHDMIAETIALSELPARFEAMRQHGSRGKTLVDPWREIA